MKIGKLTFGALVAAVLLGCTPDEVFVVVNASALNKAAAGELASAKVEMVFDVNGIKDANLPNKIRTAALPYLGEGAVVEVEKTVKKKVRSTGSLRDEDEEEEETPNRLDGAKLVARFNIPVGSADVLQKAPRSILRLEYTPKDSTFRLVPGNAVSALNSALSKVDFSIDFEYTGGSGMFDRGTTIKIANDATVKVGVAAVKVNGAPILAGSASTQKGALKIDYNNSLYSNVSPCFTLGGLQELKPVTLKEKSRFDLDD